MLIVSAPQRKTTQGRRVVEFIQQFCVHPDGEWIGKPIVLEPWQIDLIYRLFETTEDGARRYRWALVGLPKKNGKTTLAAAIALYLLLADEEPAPLIVCAAASEEQADLIFGSARTMCEMSPALRELTERWDREITVPSRPKARLMRVAAAAGTNDGKNIHANMLDEVHEWMGDKGRKVFNVLTNGTGVRSQYLNFLITTAGYDPESVLGEQYEYGLKVANGEIDDPKYFMYWRSADPALDWQTPAAWWDANPQIGLSIPETFFPDQIKKGESTFRRYFLNQWVGAETAWLPPGAWQACLAAEVQLQENLPTRVAIDIGLRHDSAAVVVAQVVDGRTVVRARVWENPYAMNDDRHALWELPFADVERHLEELRERYPVASAEVDKRTLPGPEYAYDPAFFARSSQDLTGRGLAMVEFPQTDTRMVPASQELYQLVIERKLAHDGDATLARHVANAIADQKPRGWRLSKPKGSRRKIDAAIACAIAVHRAQQPAPQVARSIYEERGIRTL